MVVSKISHFTPVLINVTLRTVLMFISLPLRPLSAYDWQINIQCILVWSKGKLKQHLDKTCIFIFLNQKLLDRRQMLQMSNCVKTFQVQACTCFQTHKLVILHTSHVVLTSVSDTHQKPILHGKINSLERCTPSTVDTDANFIFTNSSELNCRISVDWDAKSTVSKLCAANALSRKHKSPRISTRMSQSGVTNQALPPG